MGTISYSSSSGTTMSIYYVPASTESSATLHLIDYATGTESTQALTSGANSVTISPGLIYLITSSYYDAAGDLLGIGNFLFQRVTSTGAGDDFTVKWKTDYDADWETTTFDTDETRIRIPTNRRGHWFQWEIEGSGQNQRLELRNFGLEIRLSGPSYGARES